MAALNCHFAEALCLGISEYLDDQCLPKAAKDAESMAKAFRDLGCCNVTMQAPHELLSRQKTVELVSGFVLRTKRRMQQAEAYAVQPEPPLLVALFVASHGLHAHGKELPLIVPADLKCTSETEQLIDLDKLLLEQLADLRLPKRSRTCCVWIIIDTCRSGPITPWQRQPDCAPLVKDPQATGSRGLHSLKTNLTPDFLFLLACDPGGWAADSDSLSSALVESLQRDGISIRAACEHAVGMVQQKSRGLQRPWMNQRAGPIFSIIRRLPADPEHDMETECVPQWVQLMIARLVGFTTALVVLISFFGLFFCFKIAGAEHVARGEACPSNSCFCTDCHHRDIYSNTYRDPTQFNCKLWDEGPTFNRCDIAKLMHMGKIALAMLMSRKSCWRLLVMRATPLDLCVVLVSGVNVLTSIQLPLQDHTHVTLIAYSYGILNFAFIAASISILMLIHAEFPQLSQWSGGQIVSNFTAFFLITALIGQSLIFMWLRATGLISAEHAGKQEMLFYAAHVFTGATLAMVGFAMSRGSEAPVAKKACDVLGVSLSWLTVVVAWLLTSHYHQELMAKYHLLRVVAERACNFWKIYLMVWFSEHSIQNIHLKRPLGRMRAKLVQTNSHPEQVKPGRDVAPLVQVFHML